MKISEEKLLIRPEGMEPTDPEDIGGPEEATEDEDEDEREDGDDEEYLPAAPAKTTEKKQVEDLDFGDDFW